MASRRKCEELIAAGRVTINGETVSVLGTKVDPEHDRVQVDGERIAAPREHTYILLHKPAGVVSTARDPQGRRTVLDLVPKGKRLYPVGRLDVDSEGLLLLTDDGELTQRLTHPSHEQEKEYQVWVDGQPSKQALSMLRAGVVLEDGRTRPAQVRVLRGEQGGTWLRFVIHEGHKRQLRRMCRAVGHRVRRLIRVRMGPLTLDDLPPGKHRPLTAKERSLLRRSAGLS